MQGQDLLSRSRAQLLRVVSSAMGPEDGACPVVVRNGDEEGKKRSQRRGFVIKVRVCMRMSTLLRPHDQFLPRQLSAPPIARLADLFRTTWPLRIVHIKNKEIENKSLRYVSMYMENRGIIFAFQTRNKH